MREYVVIALRQQAVFWFSRQDGKYADMAAGEDGILRSLVFPGLWLDPEALLRFDRQRIREVLHRGLASPEHVLFVERLREARTHE